MADAKPAGGVPLPDAMAGNFQDAARWFNQMWSAGLDPGRTAAGVMPSMMLPTLDIKELDKRISDLRSVEQWLQLNQGLLQATIQALEMQRSGLAAWQDLGAAAARMAPGGATAADSASSAGAPEAASQTSATPESAVGASAGLAEAAGFQPALWWAALQQQFSQLAAGAAAGNTTPPGGDPAPGQAGASTASAAATAAAPPAAPSAGKAPGIGPAAGAPGKPASGKSRTGGTDRS